VQDESGLMTSLESLSRDARKALSKTLLTAVLPANKNMASSDSGISKGIWCIARWVVWGQCVDYCCKFVAL
jgi:hypothetical protein